MMKTPEKSKKQRNNNNNRNATANDDDDYNVFVFIFVVDEEWNLDVVTFSLCRTMIKPLHHYFWICCVATCNLCKRIKIIYTMRVRSVFLLQKQHGTKWLKLKSNGPALRREQQQCDKYWSDKANSYKAAAAPSKRKTFVIILSLSLFFKFPFASNYAYKLWCS